MKKLLLDVECAKKRPVCDSIDELLSEYVDVLRVSGLFSCTSTKALESVCDNLILLINSGHEDVDEIRVWLERLVSELEVESVRNIPMCTPQVVGDKYVNSVLLDLRQYKFN